MGSIPKDLSKIKLKNGKLPFTKVVGHGGMERVDRATWSLDQALTKHATVPFQAPPPPLHQVPPNPPEDPPSPPEALLYLGDE